LVFLSEITGELIVFSKIKSLKIKTLKTRDQFIF